MNGRQKQMNDGNMRIGLIGRARLAYIKEHRRRLYLELLATGELEEYLQRVESDQGGLYDRIFQAEKNSGNSTDAQAAMIAREVSMYYTVNPESERDVYDTPDD